MLRPPIFCALLRGLTKLDRSMNCKLLNVKRHFVPSASSERATLRMFDVSPQESCYNAVLHRQRMHRRGGRILSDRHHWPKLHNDGRTIAMSELPRVAVHEHDRVLEFVVRPNGNATLTALLATWSVLLACAALWVGHILIQGHFSLAVWAVFTLGIAAMASGSLWLLYWNLAFTKVVHLFEDEITIRSNGLWRERTLPVSAFHVAGAAWPYDIAFDYEFLGLGVWNVKACGARGTVTLVGRVNQTLSRQITGRLRAKGYVVDTPKGWGD